MKQCAKDITEGGFHVLCTLPFNFCLTEISFTLQEGHIRLKSIGIPANVLWTLIYLWAHETMFLPKILFKKWYTVLCGETKTPIDKRQCAKTDELKKVLCSRFSQWSSPFLGSFYVLHPSAREATSPLVCWKQPILLLPEWAVNKWDAPACVV